MLARCCMGRNPANKAKIAAVMHFETMFDNIKYYISKETYYISKPREQDENRRGDAF
jgi:hypothetical protein